MTINDLTIIGERINPGFASSRRLLESGDLGGLQQLAIAQAQQGARYLTINIGERAETDFPFVMEVIRAVQAVVDLPLSFDYPNRAVQEVCLRTYDAGKARGHKPIVNSVAETRWEMLEVIKIRPAKIVLMASERVEEGVAIANETAEEIVATAKRMAEKVLRECPSLALDDLLVDVSLCPVASDTSGQIRRAIEAIRLLGGDPELRGLHLLVGLSNIGVMLPKLALDGRPLGPRLESAFLTLTLPAGLDTILGTPGREYQILPEDDFVFQGFKEAIALDGFETISRLQQLYRKDCHERAGCAG